MRLGPGTVQASSVFPSFLTDVESSLRDLTQRRQAEITRIISDRNAQFFEAEADKLDGWADDLKIGLGYLRRYNSSADAHSLPLGIYGYR